MATRAVLDHVLNERISSSAASGFNHEEAARMQVQEAHENFVESLSVTRRLSPHTVRAYAGDVAAFHDYLGANFEVRELSDKSILAFVESQRAGGLSEASIKRRVAALRSFFKWLVSCQELPANPWDQISLQIRKPHSLPRSVPRSELVRLLESLCRSAGLAASADDDKILDHPHEATTLLAVGLMIATGVRVGEVVGIRCANLSVADSSIRVTGKGSRERTVYCTGQWIRSLLKGYLATRDHLGVDHQFLLFKRDGSPMTPPAMRGRLANASREADLRQRVTPHMLRHSAATQLIESGVDIRYVQRLLGHASIATTEIYTHVTDTALRRMITNANVLEGCLTLDN